MNALIIASLAALLLAIGLHLRFSVQVFTKRDWLCTGLSLLIIWTIAFFVSGIILKTQGIVGPIQFWDMSPGSEGRLIFISRMWLSMVLWFGGIPSVISIINDVNRTGTDVRSENHKLGEKTVRYVSTLFFLIIILMMFGFYPTV